MSNLIDDFCKYSHIRLASEGTYYGQREDYHYDVTPETMSYLLKAEIILDVLMKHGVHDWEGFDAAMADVEEELK